MRYAWVVVNLAGCALTTSARVETAIDTRGKLGAAVSIVPAVAMMDPDETSARAPAAVARWNGGVGWGTEGPFATWGIDAVEIPGSDGGTGITDGLRFRLDRDCLHAGVDVGAVRLAAQPYATDRDDERSTPRMIRIFPDISIFAGLAACDDGTRGEIGVTIELGVIAGWLDLRPGW